MALVFCSDKTYVGIVWRLNDDERQGTPGWAYCTVHIYQSGKCRRLLPKIVKVRTCGKLELQHFVVFFEFVLAIAPTPSSGCPYRHRDLRLLITNAYQLRFFAFSLPLSPARAAVGTTFVQIGLALISTWVTSSKFDNGRVDVQMYTRTHIIYIHRYPPQNARCNCTHFFVATSLHEINLASPSLIYTASSRSNVWNQRDQHFFLSALPGAEEAFVWDLRHDLYGFNLGISRIHGSCIQGFGAAERSPEVGKTATTGGWSRRHERGGIWKLEKCREVRTVNCSGISIRIIHICLHTYILIIWYSSIYLDISIPLSLSLYLNDNYVIFSWTYLVTYLFSHVFGHLWQAQRLLIYCKRGGMRSQSVAKSLGPSKGWRYGKWWISGWSLGCWDFLY